MPKNSNNETVCAEPVPDDLVDANRELLYWMCSLEKGHAGEHRAHESHNLGMKLRAKWGFYLIQELEP